MLKKYKITEVQRPCVHEITAWVEAIGEVMLFPQMKPEKKPQRDKTEAYTAIGVPQELVPVVQKAGFYMVADLKEANPQKIQQQISEVLKKYKITEVQRPSVQEITAWVEAIGE